MPERSRLEWRELAVHVDAAARVGGLAGGGGVIDGTAYVFRPTDEGTSAVTLDPAGGVARLSVVEPNSFTMATRSSPQPLLAWAVDAPESSRVEIAPPTGEQARVVLTGAASITTGRAYAVVRWSSDGRRLFVAENPTGLGGYDVYFGRGVSSLSVVDVTTGQVTTLLPYAPNGEILCYDDMTADERTVVDTCTRGVVTVRALGTGAVRTIRPPSTTVPYRILRTARFSPDGTRVAFSLNIGDPERERGAVAVSDGLGGASRLLAAVPDSGVVVDGWMDEDTLLVESVTETGCPGVCPTTTWTLDIRTGALARFAEGSVVALDVR